MFGLTPFERKSYDLFNAFHDFENDFFGENALQSFKTDIKDEGDKYVMEAEPQSNTTELCTHLTANQKRITLLIWKNLSTTSRAK